MPHAVETKGEIQKLLMKILVKEEIVQKVRELVELPLKYPELFEKLGKNLQKVYYYMVLQVLVKHY
nr:hypothetical protein [Candidatus Nanopusillus massiliensis]